MHNYLKKKLKKLCYVIFVNIWGAVINTNILLTSKSALTGEFNGIFVATDFVSIVCMSIIIRVSRKIVKGNGHLLEKAKPWICHLFLLLPRPAIYLPPWISQRRERRKSVLDAEERVTETGCRDTQNSTGCTVIRGEC